MNDLLQDPLLSHRAVVAAVVGLSIVTEMTMRTVLWHRPPSIRTTATDSSMFMVDLLLRGAMLPVRLWVFGVVAGWSPWQHPPSFGCMLVAYIAVDFVYYWKHRLFHQTKLGWALHSTHHSSRELNFLATFRVNWLESMASYFFFLPLASLGFPPLLLFFVIELNDGWQFLCHTEYRTPWRRLERWLNTPNIHRVHHSLDRELADCNYGSTLMIWDRWFGTYRAGQDEGVYGVEDQPANVGILGVQFGGLLRLVVPTKVSTAPDRFRG